ncbi:hypothetical protein [Maliponia aquimaris]|uniref:Uncharacterized protein n=1 Tax=Maliponia aquimaris TaxID=1673631 RepID=A0A238KH34_9RHOB|nr:hypothetical protein [Maliponia aquimaris]SMX41904.1 hypothetical protein MAA8898_02483 [Maliponia aquimaris]
MSPLTPVQNAGPYYHFRSRTRYAQARADLLGWYIAERRPDPDAPFNLAAFSARMSQDSPLLTALQARGDAPATLGAALAYLRGCLSVSEQTWPQAEGFETALAGVLAGRESPDRPAEPAPVTPPPEPPDAASAPRRRRPLRRLVLLLLLLAGGWIGWRLAEVTQERLALAQRLDRTLPEFVDALSGLSLTLPGYASSCLDPRTYTCDVTAPGHAYDTEVRADLRAAYDGANRLLAGLAPLAQEGTPAWFVSAPGSDCPLDGADVLDSDRALVAGLCRFRERLTEYTLCLEGHPAITERQCTDLLRLAIADTLFDCTDCPARPANVFNQRLEWQREVQAAAGLAVAAGQMAAPGRVLSIAFRRLEQDVAWARDTGQTWAADLRR